MLSDRSKHLLRELFWGTRYMLVRILCTVYEPTVRRTVRGVSLLLNWSHSLPFLVKINEYHDQPLPKFCAFYAKRRGRLNVIDAGANVGDTALLIDAEASANVLSVEASKKFFEILSSNVTSKQNIFPVCCYLGERDEESNISVENDMGNGVARVSQAKNNFRALDSLVREPQYKDFSNCHVIKTDVEGFDFKVLRGAWNLLQTAKPALFFELHVYFLKHNGEDIPGFFQKLSDLGYKKFIAYTNHGFPLGVFSTHDSDAVDGLSTYCLINYDTYFDILCIHDSESPLLSEFYETEVQRFKKYSW